MPHPKRTIRPNRAITPKAASMGYGKDSGSGTSYDAPALLTTVSTSRHDRVDPAPRIGAGPVERRPLQAGRVARFSTPGGDLDVPKGLAKNGAAIV
jgi:hypothetical protein